MLRLAMEVAVFILQICRVVQELENFDHLISSVSFSNSESCRKDAPLLFDYNYHVNAFPPRKPEV